MDLTAEVPVTLVVKAANQRIADQTVECVLGWTIRKLKQHLENVYPSKPKQHQQKLIYSGQLLADHLTLKEVLRQYDSENSRHTVHLVCSPSVDALVQPFTSQTSSMEMKQESNSAPLVSTSSSSSASSCDADGLRYRARRSQSASNTDLPNAGANPAVGLHGAAGMPGMMGMEGMPVMGMPGFQYTPEQVAWMQEVYSQYMANYMQYYGHQPYVPPQPRPATPVPEEPANHNDVNNGQPNQNLRMNAQGGLEEDEDELEQRDWLDYVYVFFRFLVLVSIVYFYSSATRFVAVSLGFLFIYMLQNGWLNNRQQQQQNVHHAADGPQQPQQQHLPQDEQEDREQTDNPVRQGDDQGPSSEEEASASEAADSDSQTSLPQQQPRIPLATEILFRMFTTFFSSLIPTRPPAIQGN